MIDHLEKQERNRRYCRTWGNTPGNAIDLSDGGGQGHFSPSNNNLRNHVFFFDNADWTTSKTIPGEFGAQASKLYHLLQNGHYDVKLAKEEMD